MDAVPLVMLIVVVVAGHHEVHAVRLEERSSHRIHATVAVVAAVGNCRFVGGDDLEFRGGVHQVVLGKEPLSAAWTVVNLVIEHHDVHITIIEGEITLTAFAVGPAGRFGESPGVFMRGPTV